jgi:hypothetical protein
MPSWDDYYRGATPEQQAELLELAGQQGFLYGHQLPASANGSTSDNNRFLDRLLTGKIQELEPLHPTPIEHSMLDLTQREAVAKALETPDVCLIQGLPATGKSRVAAEIIIRAAARGERVLFLSPWSAALDRILGLVADADTVCAVRCLGRDESLESLAPSIRGLVFPEKVRLLREHALDQATRSACETRQRADRRARDSSAWAALLELAELHRQLEERGETLRQQDAGTRAEVEAAVARFSSSGLSPNAQRDDAPSAWSAAPTTRESQFELALATGARALAETETRIETSLDELSAKAETSRRELADWKARLNALAPLARAKELGRWWTLAWWRASWQADLSDRTAEARLHVTRLESALVGWEQDSQSFNEERRQARDQHQAERTRLIDAEVGCRCAELAEQNAAVNRQSARLDEQWGEVLAALDAGTPRPVAKSADAIREARAGWQRQLEHDEKAASFASQWLEFLRHAGDTLALRCRDCVNLVAATTVALPSDPHFGDSTDNPVTFDLLMLVNAEQISEADFLAAARRARRWVLIADASDFRPAAATVPHSRSSAAIRWGSDRRKPVPPRPGLFQRIWQQLHCDPRRLPYTWEREPDTRLCCRLRTVSPEQRRWMESERVADFPDIELRIVAPPRGAAPGLQDSFLAEVVFPNSMSLRQSKEYIFHELQELPVRAHAHSLRWVEREDRVTLYLDDGSQMPSFTTPVDLGRGVRELVAESANGATASADAWHTWSVEFDRAAGFDRNRAEEWARRHLGARDLGRTMLLDAPQGIHPDLAAFLADVLFSNGYRLATSATSGTRVPVVEFVSVPARPVTANTRNPRWTGGAGLELDLADARHHDRLPAELRARLGEARGLVNYLEAQAIVRTLEHLLGGQNGFSCHARLLEGTANGSGTLDPGHAQCHAPASVRVIALYPAQAQLIRLLLEQTPELWIGRGLDIHVGAAAAFRECECDVLLLSLTRSHTHRAVTFGEGPSMLALAMTRARGRLILFGDPGTLARRAQWQGPLDHLDANDSERERRVIAQLLGYIQGQGTHASAFSCWRPAPGSRIGNFGPEASGFSPQACQPTVESRA